MKLKPSQYATALFESISEKPTQKQSIVKHFVAMLYNRHQQKLLPAIIRKVNQLENKNTVYVTTKSPLTNESKENILKIIKKNFPDMKTINLVEKINPEVIGGFIIKSQAGELDVTVANNLSNLKERLWQTT